MTSLAPHILVIDPGVKQPELASLNRLALKSSLPLTYHLPAMFGLSSLASEDMETVCGVIIMGSASSVNDRLPWQIELAAFIKPHLHKGLPALGLCFGHQFLAHIFGGQVAYAWADQHKAVGQREISLEPSRLWPKSQGSLVVSHCEAVVQIPDQFSIVGHSPEVAVEALEHRSLPIWSFQSHPEATSTFLLGHGTKLPPESLMFGHNLVQRFLDFAAGQHGS
jgi:GMP synthase (glutamine-hydrolysing)